jgi:hypothetical protein
MPARGKTPPANFAGGLYSLGPSVSPDGLARGLVPNEISATVAVAYPGYSSRKATTGSTLVARNAGSSVATSAIAARSTETPTNVTGSVGVIE